MATLKQKIQAEARMRELLRDSGMPQPDGVEYGHGCIRLFFEESKVAVVIDIDNPEEAEFDIDLDEADTEIYHGGYEPEIWEPDDAELN